MSVSHPDSLDFLLEGEEQLGASYDEQTDILYLWRGEQARPAISLTSDEGHLVRLDPDSGDIVGFTIFDFCRRWQDEGDTTILITVPRVEVGGHGEQAGRRLELVPAGHA